jgi:hypothetical protein
VFFSIALAALAALPLVLLVGRPPKTTSSAPPDHQEKLVITE